MYLLYIITPIAGYLKNYVKYKRVSFLIFSRTPLMYLCLDRLLSYYKMKDIVLWTLILERWIFFYAKIIHSYWKDHYHARQQKYIKKYNLLYPETI